MCVKFGCLFIFRSQGQYRFPKETARCFGGHAVFRIVNRYGNAILAAAGAEPSGKIYLVVQIVFLDELLKAHHNVLGAVQMAGRAYADLYLYHLLLLLMIVMHMQQLVYTAL